MALRASATAMDAAAVTAALLREGGHGPRGVRNCGRQVGGNGGLPGLGDIGHKHQVVPGDRACRGLCKVTGDEGALPCHGRRSASGAAQGPPVKTLMIYLHLTSSFTPAAAPTVFGAAVTVADCERRSNNKAELARMLVQARAIVPGVAHVLIACREISDADARMLATTLMIGLY